MTDPVVSPARVRELVVYLMRALVKVQDRHPDLTVAEIATALLEVSEPVLAELRGEQPKPTGRTIFCHGEPPRDPEGMVW